MSNTTTAPTGVVSSDQFGFTNWYEVVRYFGTGKVATITPVRVERETEHQIVLADGPRGNARRSKTDGYFRTWEEAHQHLLVNVTEELRDARRRLLLAQDRCFNVHGMQNTKKEQPHEAAGSYVDHPSEGSRQSARGSEIVLDTRDASKIETTPPIKTPLDRASDLYEKALMPWAQAEKLALEEDGIGDAEIDELIGNASPSVITSMMDAEELMEFVRAILVHQHALRPTRRR